MEGGTGAKGSSGPRGRLWFTGWLCELGGGVGGRGEQWADGGGGAEPALGMDGMGGR